MKKSLFHSFWLLSLLLLGSCEIALHDNFVPVEPLPQELPIEIKLNVSVNSTGELQLAAGLEVDYEINTPESQFIYANFYIGDYNLCTVNQSKGKFYYPGSNEKKTELRCVVVVKRLKTGQSILDQVMKDQEFQGEISWPVQNLTPKLSYYQNPEEVSLESITVRWTFNVPGYYFNVYHNGSLIASKIKEQYVTFPAPPFGSRYEVTVRIADEQGREYFSYQPKPYQYTYMATPFGSSSQLNSLYNPKTNTLYASYQNETDLYTFPNLVKVNTYNDPYSSYLATPIAISAHSDHVAVDYGSYLRILSGSNLKPLNKISYPAGWTPQSVVFTSDGKLALYQATYSKVYLYKIEDGQQLKEISVSQSDLGIDPELVPAPWNTMLNEHFLYLPLQHDGFYIIPLKGFVAAGKPIFCPMSMYNEHASFHPNYPDRLIIAQGNQVTIYNCTSGQVLHTISKDTEWSFGNIDPVSGNYLFFVHGEIIITNPDGKVLLRLESQASDPYLNNDVLTCSEGVFLNVEPYLKKP